MRVTKRAGSGRRFRLAGWLGRRVRRVATGTGMLALAVPLAWPSGVGGQHLNVPSASSVRSGVVQLADFVTGHSTPPPTVPVQQRGTAPGGKHIVPVSQSRGVKHAKGHAPGKGKGQLPQWPAAHKPGGSATGTFKAGPPVRGFDAATSKLVASATTAQTDLYKNADGSYTRKVWSNPVNYRTATGSWAPIDTTLVHGSGSRWQEKANSLAVSFAASGSDQSLGTLGTASGAQQVSFSLAGAANVAASTSGTTVTYPAILPDTDVTETAEPDGIKESLILHTTAAGTSWVFPLTLNGLTATLNGGSVNLTDSAGNLVAVIPPAVATSGPVDPSTPDAQASTLTYQLITQNGAPALEMSLDPTWLNAPGRVFPVVVDPSFKADVQGSDYVEKKNGTPLTQTNGGSGQLPSGTDTLSGSTYSDIAFLDFSELGSNLPDEHITSATLNLFDLYASQCTAAESVNAYQVTGTWSPSSALTYPGPAYGTKDALWTGTAPADACSNSSWLPGKGGWLHLTVNSSGIALLNQWTTNTAGNMGFAIVTSLTSSAMYKRFDSYNENNLTASQGGDCTGDCRPNLQITYTGDVQPQVNAHYPPNNYVSPTLSPDLLATASDSDNWPDPLQYLFTLYDSSSNTVDSTTISSPDWTVPPGDLSWGQTYYWTVQAYDGLEYSASPQVNYFSTAVPQPLVTSQLSQNPSGPGFNPQSGNWTTSATDAQVSTVGPALEITRDYNSEDPRVSGAFGAGWSSLLDMRVSAGESGYQGTTQTQIVTYPDGQDVGFGLNPDGTTYSPPPGRYATLKSVSGGFRLTDKNDTIYTFTRSLGGGAYGITSITDALGRIETFTYNSANQVTAVTSASGRSLTVNWTTPSGAAYPHVASVVTPDATPGNASTAQTWTYQYSGDGLSAACPPASTTACTAYTYVSGSDYPEAVLDSGPTAYWRLDETTSSAPAADSVLANEGAQDGTYANVTAGQDPGPLAGSSATAATFNGSAYVTLNDNLVTAAAYQTISVWFKTSSWDGVLFGSSADGVTDTGTTSGSYSPELYVGDDGRLVGAFWDGNASDVMYSNSAVNDGQWHNAVLADSAQGQELYVDGQMVGTLPTGFASHVQTHNFIGAGYLGGGWPDEPSYNPSDNTGYAYGFEGDISDVTLWGRQLDQAEVQALYAAGTRPAALLTQLTRPSGSVYAQVQYDQLTNRVTKDTDSNGGTWSPQPPTAGGSSQVYVASVLQANPTGYWRLNDWGGSWVTNTVSGDLNQSTTYYNVAEGVNNGPFSDQDVAGFDGASSYVDVPVSASTTTGPGTVGVWFKTTGTNEVLYSEQSGPVTGSAPDAYDPVLYIGADGKLNGAFLDDTYQLDSSWSAVNDGNWHYAVLAAGTDSQSLYVDGTLQETVSGNLIAGSAPWTNIAAGTGFIDPNWPDINVSGPTAAYFSGDLAELAWYPYQLTTDQVSAQWAAAQNSAGLTPIQTSTVTDPGGNTLTWTYDLLNGGRVLSHTDATGAVTSYGYDSNGFQDVVDVAGISETQTGYDVRGNMVSQTTCQDQSNNLCSTSYWTYYPDDTNPTPPPDARNDMVLTYADGRSASSTDTTYQTQYTYDSTGVLTKATSPLGQQTNYAYTTGTSAGGYNGAVPPKGLPYQVTTPGGSVTTTLYYANGDVAQVTTPDGQRTVYAYDGLGRKTSQTVYSDTYPGGLTTSYAYDANGDLITQASPAVTDRVTGAVHTGQTATAYDPDGDVTSQTVTDLTGGDAPRTVTRVYNGYDQVVSQTDAASATTAYTYDAFGNVASRTDPDGNDTAYTYDGDGHLLTTTLQNYTGSPPGSQAAAPLLEQTRYYDAAGRLATVVDGMNNLDNFYYTDNGLLAGEVKATSDWSKSFTSEWFAYDAAGNLAEQWANNGETDTTYTVDAANRLTQEVADPYGLARTTTITYTPDDQQASVTQTGTGGESQTTSYTYDPAGNVLSQSVSDPGAGGPAAWFGLTQSSGTAVPDQVAGGQPATASGVSWPGNEATFSGSAGSQVATAGPLADTTGSFSVTAWALLSTGTGGVQAVVSQAAGTSNGFTLQYDPATGDWEFARPLADTASPQVAVAGSGPNAIATTGAWAFLVGTYDANTGTMSLYVNGVAAGTATDTTPVAAHGPFTVGSAKVNGAQGEWLDGQADTVQVYPRALSPQEVEQYGGNGDITTNALTTTWTRDQRGLPTSVTDPDGAVTGYTYDEAGQLAVTTAPPVAAQAYGGPAVTVRPVTTTGYDTFGDTAETQDADGNVTTYGYDADGRQVSDTLPPYTPPGGSPITSVSTTVYDGDGLVTSATDGLGNITRYGYDQMGDQVSVTAPNGGVTMTGYDADRQPLSMTGPTGAVTDATYDYMGRLSTSTVVERATGSGSAAYTTDYSYGDGAGVDIGGTGNGGLLSQKQTMWDGTVTSSYGYDPAGEVTSATDGAGDVTSYGYDALGRKTKVTYPDGTATATGYDGAGNPVSVQQLDASGTVLATTSATYDGAGDQLSATDALGNSSTFTYDPTGLVTAEVQPVSATSAVTTSFAYDPAGNQTAYTDGNGNQWSDTYNSWGLQESRVEPFTSRYNSAATSTFTTAYDADGDPVSLTEPGGVTLASTYNNMGELTGQSGSGADAATTTRTLGYDLAGDLTSASTSNTLGTGSNATSESFTYNDRGQVLTSSGSAGSGSYGYDGNGRVTSVADAAGTTAYTYDNAGRLATLANPVTGTTATYSYNPDSLVTGIFYGTGNDTQSFGYNSLHQLTSDTLKTTAGTTIASLGYGYNADGALTSQATSGLAGPSSSSYTYDEAGRLATWNNGTTTTQYGYDGAGNLTQNGTKTYTYDARDELTSDGTGSYTYTARGTPATESSPSGTIATTFDAYGDQATAGTRAYAYDALGRLTADTLTSGGGVYQYSYAGASGTLASDGMSAYAWDPSGSTLVGTGIPGGGTGGTLALTDIHGNQAGQFTAAGTTLAGSKAYDPWGAVITATGSMTGLLGYQSAWSDPASGKDLMGARWYAPGSGGFTSADTIPQSPLPDPAAGNPYAYAADNPLTGIDPTGHGIPGFSTVENVAAKIGEAIEPVVNPIANAVEDDPIVKSVMDDPLIRSELAIDAGDQEVPFVDAATDLVTILSVGIVAFQSGGNSGPTAAKLNPVPAGSASLAPVRVYEGVVTINDASGNTHSSTGGNTHSSGSTSSTTKTKTTKTTVTAPDLPHQPAAPPTPGPSASVSGPSSDLTTPASLAGIQQQISQLVAAGVGAGGGSGLPPLPTSSGSCEPQPGDSSLASLLGGLLDPSMLLGNGQQQDTTSGGQSFTADTRVLLPGGKTAPISSLKPGDKVLANNTKTGKTQPEAVTAVLVHHDTDLYNLTVKTSTGTEVIHTTSNHLFWDPSLHRWISANKLSIGERLKTPDGTLAIADGGTTPKVHDGWMWDLTVPGNGDHDFYVIIGAAGVLVHNENYDPCAAAAAFQELRKMRTADKIPQIDEMGGDKFTRARLDLYGERFYGRNAPGVKYPKLAGTTYQAWTHAEGDAFGKALAAEMPRGGDAVLYVDQDPCPFCEDSFAGLARSLGLNSLQVVTPQGLYGTYDIYVDKFVPSQDFRG
jgi:RHS repeat-associated protein